MALIVQQRRIFLAHPTLPAQVVVQEGGARKVQADLLFDDGQAWDVRRKPHRARGRHEAQHQHGAQLGGGTSELRQ
eukprot:scaffold128792_cov51-Phaeocystis_antarctica.AAC.2